MTHIHHLFHCDVGPVRCEAVLHHHPQPFAVHSAQHAVASVITGVAHHGSTEAVPVLVLVVTVAVLASTTVLVLPVVTV